MSIDSTSSVTATGTASGSSAVASPARSDVLGKDDFLKLLVAQMRAQDPLQPLTNEAFVAQLAQFSSLEQMQNMNQTLTDSVQSGYLLNSTIYNSLATTLIGKQVKAQADSAVVGENAQLDFCVDLDQAEQSVTVKILNDKNEVIRTLRVDKPELGQQTIHWDGRNDNGNAAAAGTYRFEVTAQGSQGGETRLTSYLTGQVTGIRYRNGSAVALLGGVEVMPSDIIEVFQP